MSQTTLDLYADAGRKAARAVNEGDTKRADEECRHHARMVRLEVAGDRKAAEAAFDGAYKAERAKVVPQIRGLPFRREAG